MPGIPMPSERTGFLGICPRRKRKETNNRFTNIKRWLSISQENKRPKTGELESNFPYNRAKRIDKPGIRADYHPTKPWKPNRHNYVI
jgi:hypothetical protein